MTPPCLVIFPCSFPRFLKLGSSCPGVSPLRLRSTRIASRRTLSTSPYHSNPLILTSVNQNRNGAPLPFNLDTTRVLVTWDTEITTWSTNSPPNGGDIGSFGSTSIDRFHAAVKFMVCAESDAFSNMNRSGYLKRMPGSSIASACVFDAEKGE